MMSSHRHVSMILAPSECENYEDKVVRLTDNHQQFLLLFDDVDLKD